MTGAGKPWRSCFGAKGLALAAILAAPGSLLGEGMHWESVGVRFGFYPSGAAEDFYRGEISSNWMLPWSWHLGSVWRLQTGLDASAGVLGEHDLMGAIFSCGPTLTLNREKLPLSLEAGVSPTVITRTRYSSKNLGFPFQFTAHVGLNLDLGEHVRLIAQFEHMSNAHFARPNPGLNLLILGAGYRF